MSRVCGLVEARHIFLKRSEHALVCVEFFSDGAMYLLLHVVRATAVIDKFRGFLGLNLLGKRYFSLLKKP